MKQKKESLAHVGLNDLYAKQLQDIQKEKDNIKKGKENLKKRKRNELAKKLNTPPKKKQKNGTMYDYFSNIVEKETVENRNDLNH